MIRLAETRTRGDLAALVFECFEQRQSQAEIVIGLRVEPETVRELFARSAGHAWIVELGGFWSRVRVRGARSSGALPPAAIA
jgi:hypothetical protein